MPDVYGMRMARVNITIPDDVVQRARAHGVNVSRVATSALEEELERIAKISLLRSYLDELEGQLGPTSDDERREAHAWVDGLEQGWSKR